MNIAFGFDFVLWHFLELIEVVSSIVIVFVALNLVGVLVGKTSIEEALKILGIGIVLFLVSNLVQSSKNSHDLAVAYCDLDIYYLYDWQQSEYQAWMSNSNQPPIAFQQVKSLCLSIYMRPHRNGLLSNSELHFDLENEF